MIANPNVIRLILNPRYASQISTHKTAALEIKTNIAIL